MTTVLFFTGGILEVEDMDKFWALLASDVARKAGEEDGLKFDTDHFLVEFTP